MNTDQLVKPLPDFFRIHRKKSGDDLYRQWVTLHACETVNAGEHLKPRALKRANASKKSPYTVADFLVTA